MATPSDGKRKTPSFRREDGSAWMPTLLFVGSVSIIILFLWAVRVSRPPTASLNNPETKSASEAPQPAITPPAPATVSPAPSPARTVAAPQPPIQQPVNPVTNKNSVQQQVAAPSQRQEPTHRVQALDSLVALAQNSQTLTPRQKKDMPRLVRKMRYQGAAAVPAIRDFLRSKEDFNFADMPESELASHHTLRLVLFDTLRQIGGKEAIVALDEQLDNNNNPAEIAVLKRSLAEVQQDTVQP